MRGSLPWSGIQGTGGTWWQCTRTATRPAPRHLRQVDASLGDVPARP